MKRLFLFLSLAATLAAQTLTLTGPTTPVRPNVPITFTLTLSGSSGTNTAALQWADTFPPSNLSWTIGAAGTAAGKTLYCNSAGTLCVLVGANETAIADGVIATATWTPLVAGSFTYPLLGPLGASNAAKSLAVNVTAGPPVTLVISSPCDINADGAVNVMDIVAYINTFVFSMPTAGTVNPIASGNPLVDVQRIAAAASGAACVTGP